MTQNDRKWNQSKVNGKNGKRHTYKGSMKREGGRKERCEEGIREIKCQQRNRGNEWKQGEVKCLELKREEKKKRRAG